LELNWVLAGERTATRYRAPATFKWHRTEWFLLALHAPSNPTEMSCEAMLYQSKSFIPMSLVPHHLDSRPPCRPTTLQGAMLLVTWISSCTLPGHIGATTDEESGARSFALRIYARS
jgi:hypothetical protein